MLDVVAGVVVGVGVRPVSKRRRRHAEIRSQVRSEQEVLVEKIADRVGDLTEPLVEQVTQEVWVIPYRRPRLRVETIELPSLLEQLAQMVPQGSGGRRSSGGPGVPVSLGAISTLGRISVQSHEWVTYLGGSPRLMVNAGLRWLVQRAPTLELADLEQLDASVRSWWAAARVDAAWVDPPWRPHVPCMVCSSVGTLRVQVNPYSATCTECESSWDASTIGILGHHIQRELAERDEARRRGRAGLDV